MIIPREQYFDRILQAWKSLPIVILSGARQVGKTTIMKSLPVHGKILFINGQDPEIASMFEKLSVLEVFLKSGLNPELNGILMIDEFQFIHGIDTMLKLLADRHSDLKILCSGSSSLDMMRTVGESMAGRVRVLNVYSLSFPEYLKFIDPEAFGVYQVHDIDCHPASLFPVIWKYFYDFVCWGGLPRVALQAGYQEKRELLDDIYKTYLLRDVRSFVRNEDTVPFNRMLRLIAHQTGNLVNPHEISRISGLSYRKAEEYLWLLEQMHIILLLEPYASNSRKSVIRMKKVYFADCGLRNIITGDFSSPDVRPDGGALFENTVLLELKKQLPGSVPVRFFRSLEGTEVDFIIGTGQSTTALEVKFSEMDQPRGALKLSRFVKNEGMKSAWLISKNLSVFHEGIRFLPGILASKIAGTVY